MILNPELRLIHNQIHEEIVQIIREPSPYYHPGNWHPHCTIGWKLSNPEIKEAIGALLKTELPITARTEAIALVEYPGHHELAVFRFKG